MLKKKRFIIFGLFLCLFFLIKIDVQAENVKGDLRCPQNLSNNVSCIPTQFGSDGKPQKVELTWNQSVSNSEWIKVKKIVSKTDTVGKYNVQFEVASKLDIKQTAAPTYIAFVLDFSKTARAYKSNIVAAAREFARILIPTGTINSKTQISLIAFADGVKVIRKLKNENLDGVKINADDIGNSSHVEKGLEKAYNQLKNQNGNKYVILLGDGRYTMEKDTAYWWAGKYSDDLRNNGVKFKIVRYMSDDESDDRIGDWSETDFKAAGYNMYLKAAYAAVEHRYKEFCIVPQCNRNSMFRYLKGSYCPKTIVKCEKGDSKKTCNYIRCSEGEDCGNQNCNGSGNCNFKKVTNNTRGTHKKVNNCHLGENAYPNDYFFASSLSKKKLTNIFTTLANQILGEVGSTGVASELTDGIGPEFYLYDGELRYQKFEIENLTEGWQNVGDFDIEIDEFADPKAEVDDGLEEGWHKTNNNFKFSYTNSEGEEKTFTVKDSPEVYWVPNKTTLDSCYDSAQVDTVREKGDSDEDGIYSKVCREGFDDKFGFRVVANVNNFSGNPSSDLNKKFTLTSTMGYKFPASITLSTNLICTYRFDVAKYNEKYKELSTGIQNAEGKEKISLQKKLDNLIKVKDHYEKDVLSAQDLYNYRDDFNKQTATLKVDYPGTTPDDQISFVNVGTPTNNINCTNNASDKIDGKTIITHRTCTVSFAKDMQLPNACLNMQTGEEESCSTEVAQIAGGNNFYLKLGETGGKVTITVPKAGYGKKLDFTMDKDSNGKDSCYVYTDNTNNGGKIDFRPIDLDNPFLTNYNRKVGKNYLNDLFDFEKVIHDDTETWDKEPEYDYYMSKTNITRIINDSNEDPKRSYLGKECYFTSTGEYKCKFTQNETENGANNSGWWFFSVDGLKIK